MTLVQLSFLMLVAGAGGGILLSLLVAAGKRIPGWLGKAHGLTGLAGLVVLFGANLRAGDAASGSSWWALGVLTIALIGGLILFRVLFTHKIPFPLVALHAALAAGGLWLLNPVAFGL